MSQYQLTTVGLPTSPGPPIKHKQITQTNGIILGAAYDDDGYPPVPFVQGAEEVIDQWAEGLELRSLENKVYDRELEVERQKERERLVSGVDDKDLEALQRSFDKQVQSVRVCPPSYDSVIPVGIDLQATDDEEFTLTKLRTTLERLHSTLIVGAWRPIYEINRIRQWEDPKRTLLTLVIYSYAWWCELLMSTIVVFLSILVFIPRSRAYLFAPPIQLPSSPGENMISQDDINRIAEDRAEYSNQWGPAATETSTTHWASQVESLLLALTSGPGGTDQIDSLRDRVALAVDSNIDLDMEKSKQAGLIAPDEDKEMKRKDKAIMLYAQPAMRFIAGLIDKWERIANALDPQLSDSKDYRPLTVFSVLLLPLLFVCTFVSERMISRALGAGVGMMLFAQPLISHVIEELDNIDPEWKAKIILKLNMLENVPTNAQLILRLLRKAEHKRNPIPHPPTAEDAQLRVAEAADDSKSNDDDDDDDDDAEVEDDEEKSMKTRVMDKSGKAANALKVGARTKARRAWDKLGKAKEEGFALITGHKKVDYQGKAKHAMEKMHIPTENKVVQQTLDKLPSVSQEDEEYPASPSRFYVWHEHHGPGHILIHPPQRDMSAHIEFTTMRGHASDTSTDQEKKMKVGKGHLLLDINDIVGLRKLDMNIVGRTVLNTALASEGAGGTGLEIVFLPKMSNGTRISQLESDRSVMEETIKLTAIVRRNELFDRLLAIGDQRWVIM